jgi:hypothetical protein
MGRTLDVIGTLIANFWMVDAVDLPETTALPAVPRCVGETLRLVGYDPICDVGIYPCGLGGLLNVGPNV